MKSIAIIVNMDNSFACSYGFEKVGDAKAEAKKIAIHYKKDVKVVLINKFEDDLDRRGLYTLGSYYAILGPCFVTEENPSWIIDSSMSDVIIKIDYNMEEKCYQKHFADGHVELMRKGA